MTHFIGLVIGPDIDGQLARYDEDLQVEPYRDYLPEPKPDAAGLLPWPFNFYVDQVPGADPTDRAAVAAFFTERWGSGSDPYLADETGIYTMSTRNPDAEWDWYVVGGRWPGWIRTVDGRSADEAPADSIDWAATVGQWDWPSVVVAEGVWRQKEKHGWFGTATPTDNAEGWDDWCDRFFAGLGNLTVTAVDFHI